MLIQISGDHPMRFRGRIGDFVRVGDRVFRIGIIATANYGRWVEIFLDEMP